MSKDLILKKTPLVIKNIDVVPNKHFMSTSIPVFKAEFEDGTNKLMLVMKNEVYELIEKENGMSFIKILF